jgi:transposase
VVSESLPVETAELSALIAQLRTANSGLREVVAGQATQIEVLVAQLEAQTARIAELERRLSSDSSTSSKPPSSDPPYRKPARGSSRTSSGRKPGKQPGQPGSTMPMIDDPNEVVDIDPVDCGRCGADLTGAPVSGIARRQVTDVLPPPPPWVTEYRIYTRTCPCCATAQTGPVPAVAPARAQYGPGVLARAAELLCGHYLPVHRATALMGSMLGVQVSTGFMASVRGRAARLLETSFLPRVRQLLCQAGVLHVDETVRHEAPCDRVEVRGLHRWAVAAAG